MAERIALCRWRFRESGVLASETKSSCLGSTVCSDIRVTDAVATKFATQENHK